MKRQLLVFRTLLVARPETNAWFQYEISKRDPNLHRILPEYSSRGYKVKCFFREEFQDKLTLLFPITDRRRVNFSEDMASSM